MAVYPRGNGFQAKFMLAGVDHREQFSTEAEAEKWEFDTRAAAKAGKPAPGAPSAVSSGKDVSTMGAVMKLARKRHWDALEGSSRTAMNADLFVNWVGTNAVPAQALSGDKINEFVDYLMDERAVANGTINRYLSAISVLIKQAGVFKPELPWRKGKKSRTRFFTEDEVALVIQTLSLWGRHRERDLFIFLVDTGARPYSEGTNFRWTDLRDRIVTFDETKNDVTRSIPLTTRAFEAVERQRQYNDEGPWRDISQWSIIELWRQVREHIPGLSDTVVYTARHTCCSWQVIRGIDIARVKMWMGHKSLTTTLGYAHLAPKHLLDNLKALEGGAAPQLMLINGSSV
ncbi:site-specific integrase [Mesorhizobium sp. M0244]|uniref:tyrosine-type recombinase/integrase n=1 Tax=Mesorhizobium sp. M0244 TaxID=2956926 RepID=UPI00333A333E